MLPFQYLHAEDTDTALALLSQPGATALAGGTTLLDLMKLDVETPTSVVDIQALPWKDISLDDGALELSWRSLSEIGNLSSASVLHILRDARAKPPPSGTPGLLMAMGPGFCAELVLLRWH